MDPPEKRRKLSTWVYEYPMRFIPSPITRVMLEVIPSAFLFHSQNSDLRNAYLSILLMHYERWRDQ